MGFVAQVCVAPVVAWTSNSSGTPIVMSKLEISIGGSPNLMVMGTEGREFEFSAPEMVSFLIFV